MSTECSLKKYNQFALYAISLPWILWLCAPAIAATPSVTHEGDYHMSSDAVISMRDAVLLPWDGEAEIPPHLPELSDYFQLAQYSVTIGAPPMPSNGGRVEIQIRNMNSGEPLPELVGDQSKFIHHMHEGFEEKMKAFRAELRLQPHQLEAWNQFVAARRNLLPSEDEFARKKVWSDGVRQAGGGETPALAREKLDYQRQKLNTMQTAVDAYDRLYNLSSPEQQLMLVRVQSYRPPIAPERGFNVLPHSLLPDIMPSAFQLNPPPKR
jgi:hypothetical protein